MDTKVDNEDLQTLIARRFGELSPQLQRAARYMLEHGDDVAMGSMRELAQAAGLAPVTFVRLAQRLGFHSYSQMRAGFQERLRQGEGSWSYTPKLRSLQQRQAGTTALLQELFGMEANNLEAALANNEAAVWERAVEAIEQAERVYALGQRSSYSPAFLFTYVYRLFRSNGTLLDDRAGTVIDELRHIDGSSLIIAISVAPYTAAVVQALAYARDAGARILAITDDALSPIARRADVTLLAKAATPSFFHSIVPCIALVQALLALVAMRGGDETLREIRCAEDQLERYRAYWPKGADGEARQ